MKIQDEKILSIPEMFNLLTLKNKRVTTLASVVLLVQKRCL